MDTNTAPAIRRSAIRNGKAYRFTCAVSGGVLRESGHAYGAALGIVAPDGSVSVLSFHGTEALARKELAKHRRHAAEWRAQSADPVYMARRLAETVEQARKNEAWRATADGQRALAHSGEPLPAPKDAATVDAEAHAQRAAQVAEMDRLSTMREALRVVLVAV